MVFKSIILCEIVSARSWCQPVKYKDYSFEIYVKQNSQNDYNDRSCIYNPHTRVDVVAIQMRVTSQIVMGCSFVTVEENGMERTVFSRSWSLYFPNVESSHAFKKDTKG